MKKKLLLIAWMGCIAIAIGYLFWHYEYQYSLPTPVPENYRTVAVGEWINLDGKIAVPNEPKSVFLHFYNPKCPCSKFNVPHFQELAREYGDRVHFGVVVMAKEDIYTEREIRDKLEMEVPVAFDHSLAAACGVYSTPQAVLLDANRRLYYRGNYNKSRYCTNKETNYAQQALDSLLQDRYRPIFVEAALKSYGCQLPTTCEVTP